MKKPSGPRQRVRQASLSGVNSYRGGRRQDAHRGPAPAVVPGQRSAVERPAGLQQPVAHEPGRRPGHEVAGQERGDRAGGGGHALGAPPGLKAGEHGDHRGHRREHHRGHHHHPGADVEAQRAGVRSGPVVHAVESQAGRHPGDRGQCEQDADQGQAPAQPQGGRGGYSAGGDGPPADCDRRRHPRLSPTRRTGSRSPRRRRWPARCRRRGRRIRSPWRSSARFPPGGRFR